MTLQKQLLTFYPNLKPLFSCKHGKNQLTFLSTVEVDPPLSFYPLASAAPSTNLPAIKTKLHMHATDLLEG
jgi:hypothetical protein